MQNGLGSTKKVYKHFESSTWLIYFFFCREQSENQFTAMPKKENKIKANKQHAQAFNGGQQRGKIASDGDEKKNRRKNLTCASEFCSESNWYKVGKSGNHSAWKVANVSSALIARNPTDSFICTKLI